MTRVIKWFNKHLPTIVRVLGSVLALALLIILLEEEGDGKLFSAVRRVPIGYFLAAIVALSISRLFAAARWYILLRTAGVEIPYLRSMMLTFTGNFSSNFLPTTIGGDVVRLAGAMQLGYDRAICLASLVADRLIGMAGMSVVLPLGLVPVLSLGSGASQSIAISALFQKGVDFVRRTFESFSIWLRKPVGLSLSMLATHRAAPGRSAPAPRTRWARGRCHQHRDQCRVLASRTLRRDVSAGLRRVAVTDAARRVAAGFRFLDSASAAPPVQSPPCSGRPR